MTEADPAPDRVIDDAAPPEAAIHASYRLSIRETAAGIARLVGHGRGMRLIGAVLALTSFLPITRGEVFGWIGLALGVAMATGYVMVPVIWVQARSRADRFGATVDLRASEQGIGYTSDRRSLDDPWPRYHSVRSDGRLFALLTTDGSTRLIPVDAFDPAARAAFEALLDRHVVARSRQPGT